MIPAGVLTLPELMDLVDTVRRATLADQGQAAGPGGLAGNCLELPPVAFEAVIEELERQCRIPLLREALSCRSARELVRLVNVQVSSGV
jgi:hypothetical protein